MYNVSKDNSEKLENNEELFNGTFLWIWKPETTPPHLGISCNGSYFSLQNDKVQLNQPVKTLIDLISRKSLSLIWIKIDSNITDANKIFSKYQSCSKNDCSCVKPILEVFGISQLDGILFDLLDFLEEEGQIKNLFHRNLPTGFQTITKYTRLDVENHLMNLQT